MTFKTQPHIRADRLRYFRSRFLPNEGEGGGADLVLRLRFEDLWGELGLLESMPDQQVPYDIRAEHAGVLARAGSYASSRLNDALSRWLSIRWLYDEHGRPGETSSEEWPSFGRLCIKDAHTDVASLMDSLAFFLVNLDEVRCPDPRERTPGFGELSGQGSKHRKDLADEQVVLIDEQADWFRFVKVIRDRLVHRQAVTQIFGSPLEVFGFQVVFGRDAAITAEPLLIRPAGGPIVDFSLYGIWMLAEASHFMDQVARAAMERFGISEEKLRPGGRQGGAGAQAMVAELERLIRRASEPP